MIEARALRKVFRGGSRGDVVAADDVSFRAEPGRILGLLGPNGAGKTTTLRMIATILTPTSGTALIDGHDVVTSPLEVRRRIGFLSGGTGVYERMTAREMVVYFGRLHQMGEEEIGRRVEEIFSLLAMHEFADRLAGTLSSGQKQKLSIARTIVHDPPVLVFDEPTAALDILVAKTVVEFLEHAKSRGKCVVLSTHVLSEAEKLADDLAIIHHGRILAFGAYEEVTGGRPLEEVFFTKVAEADAPEGDAA
ncbi:MAG: ABC transporter ATP-binding protein [Planctomycetota bacterium]